MYQVLKTIMFTLEISNRLVNTSSILLIGCKSKLIKSTKTVINFT